MLRARLSLWCFLALSLPGSSAAGDLVAVPFASPVVLQAQVQNPPGCSAGVNGTLPLVLTIPCVGASVIFSTTGNVVRADFSEPLAGVNIQIIVQGRLLVPEFEASAVPLVVSGDFGSAFSFEAIGSLGGTYTNPLTWSEPASVPLALSTIGGDSIDLFVEYALDGNAGTISSGRLLEVKAAKRGRRR